MSLFYDTDDATTLVDNIAFGPSAIVPEPSSLTLSALALGMIAVVARARRRRGGAGGDGRL